MTARRPTSEWYRVIWSFEWAEKAPRDGGAVGAFGREFPSLKEAEAFCERIKAAHSEQRVLVLLQISYPPLYFASGGGAR
jgi:hypothetical protein